MAQQNAKMWGLQNDANDFFTLSWHCHCSNNAQIGIFFYVHYSVHDTEQLMKISITEYNSETTTGIILKF